MRELLPTAGVFGVLVNPQNPRATTDLGNVQAAARSLGIEIHVANASAKRDFESALAALREKHIAALIIAGDPLVLRESSSLAALASRHAIPTIMGAREFAQAGGLMSYGTSLAEPVPSSRSLCRPHSQGRETRRFAGVAADQVRVRHKLENC